MKIIISPAKKMRRDSDYPPYETTPMYLEKAGRLMEYMRSLDPIRLAKVLECSEKIALESYEMYRKMPENSDKTAAILSFDGIQYKYMAPAVFDESQFDYLRSRLFIISGLYGVLRPE